MAVILVWILSFLQIALEEYGIDLASCQQLIHLCFVFLSCCLLQCLVESLQNLTYKSFHVDEIVYIFLA